jgi:methyl-accepting chemotaxis protein
MLRRVSANVLLKSVIAVVGAVLVAVLANGAWDAWRAYGTATRLETVADVASSAFRGLHNLRLDRSFTLRGLTFDGIAPAGQLKQAEDARAAQFPALAATVANLRLIDMPERDALVGRLDKATQTLTALAKDSAVEWSKPKADRRAGLDKQYEATVNELLALLDEINEKLVAQAKYSDPFVDQMLAMRDAVWLVRYNGGDGSVTVSNGIVANKKMSVEQLQRYANIVGRTQAGWEMVEKLRVGSVLPPALAAAIDRAKASYFDPAFVAKANEILTALAAGTPSPMPVNDWTNQSVPRLASMTTLAETALDAGKQHAAGLVSSARWNLIAKLAMLIGAAVFAGVGFMLVSRRVMGPLAVLQTAMMKVANGDLAVEVPYAEREDEIGALAHALTTFKHNAGEKARYEAEQQSRSSQTASRQKTVEAHIAAFESHVGEALQALSAASGDMRQTSEKLSGSAEETNRQAQEASGASSNASTNVQTVASASQELTASINEISRQVSHAASIAGRAVTETQETDTTVQGLTDAAQRIGEVVSLINAIAEQTNLLALNATIEAARAGEAGKGFAVVAQEVKALASQTAKATGDISGQVAAIQDVAGKAVQAMRRIGGTIGEVNNVATSIASAVEEQGAATQEITRNTQEAARRTGEVADSIKGVTAGADATGTAAADVRSSAETLTKQADRLRHEVDDFLAKIRAA